MTGVTGGVANVEQSQYWNEVMGPVWVEHGDSLESQVRPFGLLALEALDPKPGEHALDVGCGGGDTTRELARRVGPGGTATGLDISAPLLTRARAATGAAGLTNVSFLEGDAQVTAVETRYDLAFSRFGVMFFEDPVAAFTNIRGALARPDGRLGFVCWAEVESNEWMALPREIVGRHVELPPLPPPGAPHPTSLGDEGRLRDVLGAAGFVDVRPLRHDMPMAVGGAGASLDTAVETLLRLGAARDGLRLDPSLRSTLEQEFRGELAPRHRPEGLLMPAAVWVVTARRG